ncbi:hypothetical protein P4S72_21510 [Vibrio sp. PP-XX7]
MNKFKLQIIGTLSVMIVAIVVILASLDFHSFKTESIDLHKQLLRERNATIEARLIVKLKSYQQMLSAIEVSPGDVTATALSEKLVAQLQSLRRAHRSVSDGVAIFNKAGDLYFENGKKLNFNVKQLNRSFYNALFNQGKTFLSLHLLSRKKVGIMY